MPAVALQDSLSRFAPLSGKDCEALRLLQATTRRYDPRSEVRAAGEASREIFIVRQGWVLESRTLKGERRQVTRLHLPGDIVGLGELAMPVAGSDVCAATGAEIAAVLKPAFGLFMREHPRIATALLLRASRLMRDDDEWLSAVGRMNVEERLQLFLLTLHERLLAAGAVRGDTFDLMLNQADIGDRCGMTSVSVSKGFQELRSRKLIYMSGRAVRLIDAAKMRENTGRADRESDIDLRWLDELDAVSLPLEGAEGVSITR